MRAFDGWVCSLLAGWLLFPVQASAALVASADGITVYDTVNNVTWLADANLAASNRFVLPSCGTGASPKACVNPSGSMNYQSASAWVAAMNAAGYLGHTNWQLPSTPTVDTNCGFVGPNGNSFGFGCSASALASLFYKGLGLKAPNTAVPIVSNTAGPFSNFQPYLYWSGTVTNISGNGSFSFNTGFHGSNTTPNFLYVLPMIRGRLAGTSPAPGKGLQVNPGGQTVYDPVANVTWLANANLGASNAFGLPACKDPGTPKICVNSDGAMNWNSADQFITNMNAAGYLGQNNWQLPNLDTVCDTSYACASTADPLGQLYYGQLGLSQGAPVAATPDIAVGPFRHIQPYLYWACQANVIQDPCQATGPATGFEWSFSFGNGFQGTDVLANEFYATAYFVGQASSSSGPVIAEVANAEGESPVIAPNTWVEIKGANLAPAGDARIWKGSDFVGNQLPRSLDGVSVTVNGKAAYVYYISPTQINILTPPDAMPASVTVQVTTNGAAGASFTVQAKPLSPSFFVFNGGPYVAATHADGSLLGPASLYPGLTTPAKPGETVVLYANGFGATSTPVVSGSLVQSGTLTPLPAITIGGQVAMVQFAGLVAPGQFQFNVVIPANAPTGDNTVLASFNGSAVAPAAQITVAAPVTQPTSVVYYVSPIGNDFWSGALAAPNAAATDGPFASFERARAAVQALNKAGLTQVAVQFRGGTYHLPATQQFAAADSGTAGLKIIYQNYGNESPVFSGGVRIQNWAFAGGNTWKATLPASAQNFENLFYNGARRLRPRLGGYLGTYYRIAATTAPSRPRKVSVTRSSPAAWGMPTMSSRLITSTTYCKG